MTEGRVAVLLRISQGLKNRLADLAKLEHRSLNQQIEFLLEQSLSDKVNKHPNEQQVHKGGHGKYQGSR